jgi:atypical dual specificity phosphatase
VSNPNHRRAFPSWYRLWARFRSRDITWYDGGRVGASRHPRRRDLREAHRRGVRRLVNLSKREGTHAALLTELGLEEVRIPVQDLRPPTPEQLEAGVAAIREAIARGDRVLVHCDAGLGRTGTLIACYLVTTGLDAPSAIAAVRAKRPGSVETYAQEAAVEAFAAALRPPASLSPVLSSPDS